jgi:sodium/proline symporter
MEAIAIFSFVCYLIIVVTIAVVAWHMTKNLSDFVLGGRQLGGPVAALSAGASDMSAWLLLGLPGAVFVFGLNQIWLPIGLTVGAYLSWRMIAKPLRVYSEVANDSLTVPAFLDNRFKDNTAIIRVMLAVVTLVFFAFYTASGLVGGAMLLERFGLSYEQALLLGTTIIVAYTFVGGFLAVSWTDFFQGTLMFWCLLAVPLIAGNEFGGWGKIFHLIGETHAHKLDPLHQFNGLLFVNLFAWGLGYLGQPHILVRYMAVRTTRDIPIARRICISWMSVSMLGAVLTGFVGIAFFAEHPIEPESVFIAFSQQLFSPWLAGILFAAILSSIMCAIDSQMLASSSALTEDLYHRIFRKQAKQKELVWVGRVGIIVIACVAVALAAHPSTTILNLVAFAWAGLASSFGPSVVGALFWRRMTAKGCILGLSLGALAVIIWKLNSSLGGVFSLYEIIPGFFFGSLGVIFGSLLDKPPSQDITDQFDQAWRKIRAS